MFLSALDISSIGIGPYSSHGRPAGRRGAVVRASARADAQRNLVFDYGPPLPGHVNGLVLTGRDTQGDMVVEQTYYLIGGGFVRIAEESEAGPGRGQAVPCPFARASASASSSANGCCAWQRRAG